MLVDAAGAPPAELHDYGSDSQGVPSKPNINVSAGAVIVNYIKHFAPSVANGRLDYFMTSHYHGDHIGAWRSNYNTFGWTAFNKEGEKVSTVNLNDGGFLLNGIAEVGLSIPIDKVLDRGDWSSRPSADYYDDGGINRYKLYVNYLDYAARKQGTVRETLKIGHEDQIVLKHNAAKYTTFGIRTIASGGDIWTGKDTEVNTTYMPSTEECQKNHTAWAINENILSNVFMLRFGNFDFFSGGDIQYSGRSTYAWKDIEKPISQVVKKVEGMKACHHSTSNTNSDNLLNALRPDFFLAGVWRDVQPNPTTLQRVLKANDEVKLFATNMDPANLQLIQDNGIPSSRFSSTQGHVVIRVEPSTVKYWIFVLDDSNEQYKVKAKLGPFRAQ